MSNKLDFEEVCELASKIYWEVVNKLNAEDKCVMGTVWNTQNEGSSEFGGAERGFNGIHQAGDTGSATSSIRINSRLGAQSAANGQDTDFDGTYCAIVGDLA